MAVWRTKACGLFGFKRDEYSHIHSIARLFGDLHHMAERAATTGRSELLDRIFEYVQWADAQNAENLRSAADIAFFMPVLRDPQLAARPDPGFPRLSSPPSRDFSVRLASAPLPTCSLSAPSVP